MLANGDSRAGTMRYVYRKWISEASDFSQRRRGIWHVLAISHRDAAIAEH